MFFFFFNDTATTEIYTLSLHDALPISTATSGRNMTRPAYIAVAVGTMVMILLTVDPAYEAAHHWVDAVLWACLSFFVFEWVVRLRHAVLAQRGWTYALSGRGLVDT